ncbi:hypothetical protein EXIGLDRAFT_215020 [Exidia glandulosa HHB12029]|uniref:Protein kinase domain-containing protein n=1 Tax=Exidia glandulosa HHB12029 TaxID=1314781 RepID=A0A165MTN5_EXIGL|nr:hypothetical protein EXIGLDRAFT_215020 [Exidia glandulosa HHB12029]
MRVRCQGQADILYKLGSVWSRSRSEMSMGRTANVQTADTPPVSLLPVESSLGSPTLGDLPPPALDSKVRTTTGPKSSGPSQSFNDRPRPAPIQKVTGNRVIPVLEVIAHDTWRFVVMPYWAGGPCRGPPFNSPEHYLLAARQMIQGLVFLHNQRRVHLNISPSNIVMNHFTDQWKEAKWESGTYLNFYDRRKFDCQYAYIGFTHSRIVSDDGMLRKSEFPRQCHRVPELATDADLHSDAVHDAFKVDVWMLGQVLKEQFEQNARFEEEMQIPEEHRLTYFFRQPTSQGEESFGQSYLSLIELEMMDPDPSYRLTAAEALAEIERLQSAYWKDRARRAAVQATTATDLEAPPTSATVDLESDRDETGLDTQASR